MIRCYWPNEFSSWCFSDESVAEKVFNKTLIIRSDHFWKFYNYTMYRMHPHCPQQQYMARYHLTCILKFYWKWVPPWLGSDDSLIVNDADIMYHNSARWNKKDPLHVLEWKKVVKRLVIFILYLFVILK